MAIRAFVRLSWHFYTTGVSWYAAKAGIVREAIRAYRSHPLYRLCRKVVRQELGRVDSLS
jgi:putative transposase